MTLVPAVLVLLVGSELIRNSVDRWFNAPMDEVLSSAQRDRRRLLPRAAALVTRPRGADRARAGRPSTSAAADVGAVRDVIAPEVTAAARRAGRGLPRRRRPSGAPRLVPVVDVAAPTLPPRLRRARRPTGWRRAPLRAAPTPRSLEPLGGGGELVRAAALDARRRTARPSASSWSRATT